ncbi:hypothetical protein NQZ68_010601, partial [Dissostichus eleginoides]
PCKQHTVPPPPHISLQDLVSEHINDKDPPTPPVAPRPVTCVSQRRKLKHTGGGFLSCGFLTLCSHCIARRLCSGQ